MKAKSSIYYINSNELSVLLFAFLIFSSTAPFYFWGVGTFFILGSLISIFLIVFLKKKFKINLNYRDFFISIIVFFASFYYFFNSEMRFGSIIFAITFLIFFNLNFTFLTKVFYTFKNILAVFLFPSILLWLVHILLGNNVFLSLGILKNDIIPNQLKVEQGFYYYYYPFMTIVSYDVPSGFYRFPGIYDEPGVIGTLTSLLLCADKFNFKSKSNKVLLISGLFSFSLVFYVVIFIYFIFNFFKSVKRNVIYLFIVFAIFLVIFLNKAIYLIFDEMIFSRLIFRDGDFSGNNRSTEYLNKLFENWYTNANTYNYLFGYPVVDLEGSSSLKQIFLLSGILGFVAFLLTYCSVFLKNGVKFNNNVCVFTVIFFLILYQRPDLSIFNFFILLFAIPYLSMSEK